MRGGLVVLVCLVCLSAGGCTTWRVVETPDAAAAVAEIGVLDTVRIVTADGERHQFRVAAIKADAIIGNNNERVPIEEIHMIEVKRFDAAGTGLLVLGPPLVAAGLLVISIGTMSF